MSFGPPEGDEWQRIRAGGSEVTARGRGGRPNSPHYGFGIGFVRDIPVAGRACHPCYPYGIAGLHGMKKRNEGKVDEEIARDDRHGPVISGIAGISAAGRACWGIVGVVQTDRKEGLRRSWGLGVQRPNFVLGFRRPDLLDRVLVELGSTQPPTPIPTGLHEFFSFLFFSQQVEAGIEGESALLVMAPRLSPGEWREVPGDGRGPRRFGRQVKGQSGQSW